MKPDNPIIVQSDRTILLEVDHTQHAEARDALAQFDGHGLCRSVAAHFN